MQTTAVSELDTLWPRLMGMNPQDRPTAQEVLDELGAFVRRTPPERLHVPFTNFFKLSLSGLNITWPAYVCRNMQMSLSLT